MRNSLVASHNRPIIPYQSPFACILFLLVFPVILLFSDNISEKKRNSFCGALFVTKCYPKPRIDKKETDGQKKAKGTGSKQKMGKEKIGENEGICLLENM